MCAFGLLLARAHIYYAFLYAYNIDVYYVTGSHVSRRR